MNHKPDRSWLMKWTLSKADYYSEQIQCSPAKAASHLELFDVPLFAEYLVGAVLTIEVARVM